MQTLVEFCTRNYRLGTKKAKKVLNKNEDFEVLEHSCLGNCRRCAVVPFAVVEGEFIEAEQEQELLSKIKKEAEAKEQMNRLFDMILDE